MKKGKLIIFGLAVLSVASVGATWAAWSDHEQARNEYRIPEYKTKLEETFEPPEDWQPGMETEKAVWVSNLTEEGNGVPVIAKVVMEQRWESRKTGQAKDLIFQGPSLDDPDGAQFSQYAAIPQFTEDVYLLASGAIPEGTEDSGLRLGLPVVQEEALVDLTDPDNPKINEAYYDKWILVDEDPDITGRYTLYYLGVIQPGSASVPFLESVKMNPVLEPELVKKLASYEELPDGGYKEVYVEVPSELSQNYEDCRYTMEITATTVQATKDAVSEVLFQGRSDADVNETVKDYLIAIGDDNVYDAALVSEKRLKIEGSGTRKHLVYTPYRTEGGETGNWFMSFTDMLPGGTYYDTLLVENDTNIALTVFGQILPMDSSKSELPPVDQSQLADELLDMIHMRVWNMGADETDVSNGTLIYEGTATGMKAMTDGGDLASNLVSFCRVPARTTMKVRVELKLDPGIVLDETVTDPNTGETVAQLTGKTYQYADVLSKIDWHFWSQGGGDSPGGGTTPGGGGGTPPTPTTYIGDDMPPLTAFIPDEEVPLIGLLPETGDETPIYLLGMLSLLCLAALAAAGAAYRRAGRSEKDV